MPTPTDWLDRARGREITMIMKTGVGAFLLSIIAGWIRVGEAMFDLILTPVEQLLNIVVSSAQAFVLGPLGVVDAGAETTASSLDIFGILALPLSVATVLATLYIVQQYLAEQETTDVPFPGISVDLIPFVGAEEEPNSDN